MQLQNRSREPQKIFAREDVGYTEKSIEKRYSLTSCHSLENHKHVYIISAKELLLAKARPTCSAFYAINILYQNTSQFKREIKTGK